MKIGKNIKSFRVESKMEQKELAKRLNVSNKTVSSWECGRTEPNIGMLERIAEVLGITKSDLVEEKGTVYRHISKNPPKIKADIILSGDDLNLISAQPGSGKSSFVRNILQLTNHERKVLEAYRKYEHKEAIDAILGIKGGDNDDD